MSDALVERLAGVLREHPGWTQEYDEARSNEYSTYWRFRCDCGDLLPRGSADKAHRAHVAQMQAVAVEQEIAAARAGALREAATSLGHIHQADSAGASACIRWLRDRAARIARTAAQTPATSTEEER